MRHLLTVTDLSSAEIERIFAITADLKSKYSQGVRESLLPNRVVGMLFEKPSLRTRVSFEAGMAHLGGMTIVLGEEAPPDYHFAAPVRIPELYSAAKTDNPSLTADLREIYFTSERTGGPAEVWFATRAGREDAFGVPQLASALNSPAIETSSVICAVMAARSAGAACSKRSSANCISVKSVWAARA